MGQLTTTIAFHLVLIAGLSVAGQDDQAMIEFNRDIRPILSDNCFKCHGPDAHDRQADLRLDSKDGIADAQDLLSPGDAEESELFRRIITDDHSEIMPPADSGRELSDKQKELIRKWIEQGAQWQNHWSFVSPQKRSLPPSDYEKWCHSPIDHFVAARLQAANLSPNVEADRATLIRRLCLDLTGLPPDEALSDRYRNLNSIDWYEQLVDELLDSPNYGEHMARFWLDAARYGDTHGLHLDNYREMWLYRDWVVRSFNSNLSFRDFLIQQLAGDLLENRTEDQLVATGFNRAHVTTNEGGSITEEVKVRNVVDRVSTTGIVFLGLTVGCAQCHDHKYDPISQKEFYELYAFFNSLDGNPMDGNIKDHAPIHRHFSVEDKLSMDAMKKRSTDLDQQIKKIVAEFNYQDPANNSSEFQTTKIADQREDFVWFDDQLPAGTKDSGGWSTDADLKVTPYSGETAFVAKHNDFTQMYFLEANPPLYFSADDTFFAMVYLDPNDPPDEIMLQFNNGNWNHRAFWGKDLINFGKTGTPERLRLGDLPAAGQWVRLEVKAQDVGFKGRTSIQGIAFSQHGGTVFWDTAGVSTKLPQTFNEDSLVDWLEFIKINGSNSLPKNIRNTLKAKKLDDKANQELNRYYVRHVNPRSRNLLQQPLAEKDQIQNKLKKITGQAPTTLVWKETAEPVAAYVLNRGEYDQKGEQVYRKTPDALPDFSAYRRDRLGLAYWLVDENHPLTARVAVNRIWQQFFGNGIVATAEDFGAQGEMPSHPELLDWLAVDFIENDWNIKRLVKQILMSATYRQSSAFDEKSLLVDKRNRLLSRGTRTRLDAEVLRDQALAVSGLLVNKLGGPSVKPPQPGGLWFAVGYTGSNTVRFKKDTGHEKVHRRSLYTFWKRTAPPPQMSTFDAPSRESCVVRRERTNTPLQALLLMNDPQFVEAARYFAQRIIDSQTNTNERIRMMFQTALAREPSFEEFEVLQQALSQYRENYDSDAQAAKQLVAIGESPANKTYDSAELAAYTMLANLIMNMDEFISRN